ncbi:MAG: N-6 DNA methylase [Bacteroides sp.]|nr:N-6 DNA methylase [Bacteroides sp.]
MFNTNSTSAFHSLNISDILLPADWEKQTADDAFGNVFNPKYFATDWNSIYYKPSILDSEYLKTKKGMRKLTMPTLLITSKQAKMVYLLATNNIPIYIPSEYEKHPDYGYLMAFRLSLYSSPEYIFYCCKSGEWDRLLKRRINRYNDVYNWNNVGIVGCDAQFGEIKITPEEIVRNIGKISIPTINEQEQLIVVAQKHDNKIHKLISQPFEVVDLVRHYTRKASLFHPQPSLGLMTKLYHLAAGNHANLEVLTAMRQYEFQSNILNEKEIAFLTENLDKVVDQVLVSDDMARQRADGFIQPQEVTDLMCHVASFSEDVTVYNPFAGAASYGLKLHNRVVGEEINPISWAIGQIRLFAHQSEKRVDITLGDSFIELHSAKKYPAIIASPAYLYQEGQEITDIVSRLYAKLEDGGKMVCIVTGGFLYTKNNSATQLRELLIKDHAIKSVIMLPSNIFMGTSVPQALIVLSKDGRNHEIEFGNATDYVQYAKSIYRTTTLDLERFIDEFEFEIEDTQNGEDITENQTGAAIVYSELIGSDLRPSIYLTPKPGDGIALSELATSVPELTCDDIQPEYYITNTSIPEAMHYKPFVPTATENEHISSNLSCVVLEDSAVILTLANGKLRTVYTDGFVGKVAFPAGTMKILQPREGVSAKYLAALLACDILAEKTDEIPPNMILNQIKAQIEGAIIPALDQLELSRINLLNIVNAESRDQFIICIIAAEWDTLSEEIQKAYEIHKREVRSTRHAMIQTLAALSSNWEQLNFFTEMKGGKLNLSDIIGRINPMPVKDLMGSIAYSISTLQRQVEALRFEKSDWGKPIAINPHQFINGYITTNSTPSVRMVNIGNESSIQDFCDETSQTLHKFQAIQRIFYAPERLLERIFDNIVANAMAHGFCLDHKNNEIRFDWMSENGNIVITIANNGLPLKEGVSCSDVLMSGFSTALNEEGLDETLHSGQGGFEIKSLMEGLGSVEVISKPEAEFPVIYKLTFEKTDIVNN